MAWVPAVRAFLRAARRELDWRESRIDRTLMGFVALHMHDKIGGGLSNSMSPTIAYSPRYAVRWWTEKGLTAPPDIDPGPCSPTRSAAATRTECRAWPLAGPCSETRANDWRGWTGWTHPC